MERHNLHYADKSIIHEQNSSQNSKTQLFDLRITTVHPFLLSSSSPLSGLLSYTEWALGSTRRGAPASAVPGRSQTPCLLHQGSIVTHRRCGLVMISRDYGWLMVGKYIRNHRLWKGGGDFTHASGFALIHSK